MTKHASCVLVFLLQTHVVEKFSNHYVTVLLSKHGELGDTYSRLWMDAVAKATATLLRYACCLNNPSLCSTDVKTV